MNLKHYAVAGIFALGAAVPAVVSAADAEAAAKAEKPTKHSGLVFSWLSGSQVWIQNPSKINDKSIQQSRKIMPAAKID